MGDIVYRRASSVDAAGAYLAGRITELLKDNRKVLWLVPGGSAIAVAVSAAQQLTNLDLSNLTVSLTDERYGEVGHNDSNWAQLTNQGLVLNGADLHPVLTGKPVKETIEQFNNFLRVKLDVVDATIGLFGIGADGHTAGILPGSPAVTSQAFAAGYQADPYFRITMTGPAIAKLDEAIVYAMDDSKRPVIEQLQTDVPVEQQPAQFLKQVPKLIIYNGYKGEES